MLMLVQRLAARMLLIVAATFAAFVIGRAQGHGRAAVSCAQSLLQGAQHQAVTVAAHDTADAARSASIEREHLLALANFDSRARVVTREVVRYVDSHRSGAACSIDADGLRLWTSANAGTVNFASTGAAGSASAAVPAAATAGEPNAR